MLDKFPPGHQRIVLALNAPSFQFLGQLDPGELEAETYLGWGIQTAPLFILCYVETGHAWLCTNNPTPNFIADIKRLILETLEAHQTPDNFLLPLDVPVCTDCIFYSRSCYLACAVNPSSYPVVCKDWQRRVQPRGSCEVYEVKQGGFRVQYSCKEVLFWDYRIFQFKSEAIEAAREGILIWETEEMYEIDPENTYVLDFAGVRGLVGDTFYRGWLIATQWEAAWIVYDPQTNYGYQIADENTDILHFSPPLVDIIDLPELRRMTQSEELDRIKDWIDAFENARQPTPGQLSLPLGIL